MTGRDVPDLDMLNSLWPSRRAVPVIGDASLAALLAGAELPAGSAPELRPLVEALAGLRDQPVSDELEGEAGALAAFRNQLGVPNTARQRSAQTPPSRFRPRPVRAAAVAVAMVLGLGGIATAAYAGALPSSLQRLAHDIVGAPAPGTGPAVRPSWASPAARGHRAYGLCTAWAHGTHKQQAVAFRELAAAADGRGNVSAYCATVAHPGTSPSHRPAPAPDRTGRPGGLPTPHGSGRRGGLPTPHGSGKPTGLPAPNSTSAPTAHPTGGPSRHL